MIARLRQLGGLENAAGLLARATWRRRKGGCVWRRPIAVHACLDLSNVGWTGSAMLHNTSCAALLVTDSPP